MTTKHDDDDDRDAAELLPQRVKQPKVPGKTNNGTYVLMGLFVVGVFLLLGAAFHTSDSTPIPVERLRNPIDPFVANWTSARSISSVVTVKIPRIIHQTWNSTTDIPERLQPHMRSWADMHPGWKYVFWTRNDTIKLMQIHYPRYYDAAAKLSKAGFDEMARYAILHYFGGVFVASDFECKFPIDELNRDHNIFVGREPFAQSVLLDHQTESVVSTKLMGSISRHQFWLHMMEAIKARYDAGEDMKAPVNLLRQVQNATMKNGGSDVKVLDQEYFFPAVAAWRMDELRSVCGKVRPEDDDKVKKKACVWLDEYPSGRFTNDTRAVYYWPCERCVRDKETREWQREPKVSLWEVMELPNGAAKFSFRPHFYRSTGGLEQIELKFNSYVD